MTANGVPFPVKTGEKQSQWKPGESGNPAGRPKGSRNKLSEAFLQALADDFDANGKEVIERVRTERPHDYLKVCASVMPKRLENEDVTPINYREMTDAELEAICWKAYAALGVSDEDVADAAARLEQERQHEWMQRRNYLAREPRKGS
jgi:hypothetical protein